MNVIRNLIKKLQTAYGNDSYKNGPFGLISILLKTTITTYVVISK